MNIFDAVDKSEKAAVCFAFAGMICGVFGTTDLLHKFMSENRGFTKVVPENVKALTIEIGAKYKNKECINLKK